MPQNYLKFRKLILRVLLLKRCKSLVFKYQIGFFLFTGIAFMEPVSAQSALYFTHAKVSNLKKLETTDSFSSGDTVYGVLYVSTENSSASLDDYARNQNGTVVVPVSVASELGDEVNFTVELSSGIIKPKKAGLMSALSNAISSPPQAFYFQILPTSGDGLSMNWMKFLARLSGSSNAVKTIRVAIGTGESFHTATGRFTLDFSGGTNPYRTWISPYLEQENKVAQAEIAKKKADSIARVQAEFDNTEHAFPPAQTKSKITEAKLQKELTDYFKKYYEVYKVVIWDAENSYTFQVFAIVKDGDQCFILSELLERQNPYGDIVKFKFADIKGKSSYKAYPLRSEKVQDYLK